LIAALLAGAWRGVAASLDVTAAELATIAPPLLETGAAALAWWRLRRMAPGSSHVLRPLAHAYRHQAIQAAVYEQHLVKIIDVLRRSGVEPIVVKGWSATQLYADPALRPSGDIDLCVAPDQLASALAAVEADPSSCGQLDLHAGVADLEDRDWEEVFRRSQLLPLQGTAVRALCPEDQLRHLCLHLMRHGAFRPLWLCDVAAALEALPADFDWDYCLSGARRLTDWVVCAIGLARRLLDAHVADAQVARRSEAVPRWLESTILRLWDLGLRSSDVVTLPFTAYPRTWAGLHMALGQRWPNPIRAAYKLRLSPFTSVPRQFIQLAAFLVRTGQYASSKLRPATTDNPARHCDVHPAQIR